MEKPTISQLISLDSKVALITGGAMGIGQGIAQRLHEAGAKVAIVDIDLQSAQNFSSQLNTVRADSALAIQCDVSNSQSVQQALETTIHKFGKLDILVNNAGIFPFANLGDLTEETFDKILAINLKGVFLFCKAATQQMRAQGTGGKIINIASVDALHPSMVGLAGYDASKHGVWGFTKNIALELAKDKIWVNAIAPGGIATPGVAKMVGGDLDQARKQNSNVPMGRMGESDDMARVALFLASDLASYMTGSILVADGGMLLQ